MFATYVGISIYAPGIYGRIHSSAWAAWWKGPEEIRSFKAKRLTALERTYPKANVSVLLDEYARVYPRVVSRRCDFATDCLIEEQKQINSDIPSFRNGVSFIAGDIVTRTYSEDDNTLLLLPREFADVDADQLSDPGWYDTEAKKNIVLFYVGSVPFKPIVRLYDAVVDDELGEFEKLQLYERDRF